MAMTNEALLHAFANGYREGKSYALSIDGDKLFHYSTVIAQRINGKMAINITSYSRTTTKHQNALRRIVPNEVLVEDVKRGVQDLTAYIEA